MNISAVQLVIILSLLMLVTGGTVVFLRQTMHGIMKGFILSLKALVLLALMLSQLKAEVNQTLLLVALVTTCLLPLLLSIFFTVYLRLIRFKGSASLDVENSLRQ